LLHGGGGDGEGYADLATVLATSFRVITPDMRGHGRSTDTDEPLSYESQASDVLSVMDALQVPRAHVVGYSDGGNVGLILAITHPERVDHLATFGANLRPTGLTPATAAWVKGLTPAGWKEVDPKLVEKLKKLWTTQPNLTAHDLAKIHAPSLIACADRDDIQLEHCVEIFRDISGAQLLVMPGAQHSHRQQDPVLVERVLTRFLGTTK
jgi:pimeloyl-ACP methyl ester carboxylesterase